MNSFFIGEKKGHRKITFFLKNGAEGRTRTGDLLITNQLHYQLCYFGVMNLKIIQSYLKYIALFITIV
ncbi:hypothetical protein BAZSYMA_ACONTIG00016_7 [Bathymodiolus azoricus thioautotrophic gill symbiont]|uniref:Uncharacterized protein n=1 Tax=Bathymodiolus azoricus thioautotrophic gill symbiont TaxID=235205 RepID=A0A1H6L792_9GAMM|nr:hypothetical protein BAZSYMA_ACONTIG00016_7 [Bathymodiolus azoricus thioautotrophic gill symbiont]